MDFYDWWAISYFDEDRWPAAQAAWEAATLAERERCAKIVDIWAQGCLSGDLAVDVIDGVADAIRNPNE